MTADIQPRRCVVTLKPELQCDFADEGRAIVAEFSSGGEDVVWLDRPLGGALRWNVADLVVVVPASAGLLGYPLLIAAATGEADRGAIRRIEDVMRGHTRGGVLDSLAVAEFSELARQSAEGL